MKGILDIAFIMVLAFILGFVFILTNNILTDLQTANANSDNQPFNNTFFEKMSKAFEQFNIMFIFLMVGAFVGSLIGAFFVRTHPIFFIASFISLVFLVMSSAILTNAFEEIITNPELSDSANEFDLIVTFMRNLPTIVTIFGFVLIGVMFGRRGATRS